MADDPTQDPDARANEAVAWYYRQCEAGTPPAAGEFLARFPDVRGQLEAFLADKAAFDHAVGHDPNATLAPLPVPAVGERIRFVGDYELLGEIARGGMGVVFHAKQVSLNREVAVKMILAGELAGATAVQRFRAEAEAAANLDHPNILPIYEVGEHQGQPYFSMKLVGGGSFGDKLSDRSRPNVRGNVATLALIARAVHFAHQRGILHRDLKPANVLLDADGTPFVTDFGLAKRAGDSGSTQTGAVVGTPSYMPPEQARGEKGLTVVADVYALGAMLYEVLTGRPPFRAGTVMDTLLQVLEKEPEYPIGANRDLAAVALKCLSKKPGDRYASAAELADDLDRWAAGEPTKARPLSPAAQALRWVRRNAAAVILVPLLGILWGGSVGLGFVAGNAATGDTRGDMYAVFAFPPRSEWFSLLWWIEWMAASPAARWVVLGLAVVTTVGIGRLSRAAARPATPQAAVAAASAAALIAMLTAAQFFIPLVVGDTMGGQVHILSREDELARWAVLTHGQARSEVLGHDFHQLEPYLPPGEPRPDDPDRLKDKLAVRERAVRTNKVYAASLALGASTLFGLVAFLGIALSGTWASGLATASGRGVFVRVPVYVVAHVFGIVLAFASASYLVVALKNDYTTAGTARPLFLPPFLVFAALCVGYLWVLRRVVVRRSPLWMMVPVTIAWLAMVGGQLVLMERWWLRG